MNNLINIENRAGKIKLNDSVHKESADQLIDELEQLYGESAVASNMQIGDITCSAENALESVDVEINSPGGSVFEGQRIYNALTGISSRGVHVTTTVNGLAASMGSVILMAGDTRKMTQGSRIMIHEASTMAYGDAAQLRTQSNVLEGISSEIAAIYSERGNGSEDEMRALMKNETWMDTAQAKELGFVDTIIKNGKESEASNELNSSQSTTTQKPMFKEKELQAKISEHEASIVSLTEDMTATQKQNDDLNAKLESIDADHKAKVDEVSAELVTANADLEASKVSLAESEAKQEGFDLKVSEGACAKMAELGIPPVHVTDDVVANEMTRAEFNKLTPSAKSRFSIDGGKIK